MRCVFSVRRGGRDEYDGVEGRCGYGEIMVFGEGRGVEIWLRGKGVGGMGKGICWWRGVVE